MRNRAHGAGRGSKIAAQPPCGGPRRGLETQGLGVGPGGHGGGTGTSQPCGVPPIPSHPVLDHSRALVCSDHSPRTSVRNGERAIGAVRWRWLPKTAGLRLQAAVPGGARGDPFLSSHAPGSRAGRLVPWQLRAPRPSGAPRAPGLTLAPDLRTAHTSGVLSRSAGCARGLHTTPAPCGYPAVRAV